MSEWISVKDRLPIEGESDWYNIKTDGETKTHSVKYWEDGAGSGYFVNILFEKEKNVTEWKPEPPKDL